MTLDAEEAYAVECVAAQRCTTRWSSGAAALKV
jgi:hypothetical protein